MITRQITLLFATAGILTLAACDSGSQPGDQQSGGLPSKPAFEKKPTRTPAHVLRTDWKLPHDPAHRFGDAGLEPVDEELADLYPQQAKWTKCGVMRGIPKLEGRNALAVASGESIQKAIDEADADVITLAAGQFGIDQPIRLKSGVVLRGSAPGTTIRYGGQTEHAAIVMENLKDAGVEDLDLVYADPRNWGSGGHRAPGVYANAPGFAPGAPPAILIENCTDTWISDVTVLDALSEPLRVQGSNHCTIRGLTAHGVINRGNGAGEIAIANSHNLLLTGLNLRGLRKITLEGPVTWSVFRGMISGCGVYFVDSDRIEGVLFEDCHFLFRPGHIFEPLAKDPMPMGPDCLITNSSVYHHGTNGLAGNVMQPRLPYSINPYADRVTHNAITGASHRHSLVSRLTETLDPAKSITAKPRVAVGAQWKQPPTGIPVGKIRNQAIMDDWLWTTSVGPRADTLDIAPLLKQPLQPGQKRQIDGRTVAVDATDASRGDADRFDPLSRQKFVGKSGMRAIQPPGRPVPLVDRVGGDWQGGLVLQRVVHIPGGAALGFDITESGCETRAFLNDIAIDDKHIYEVEPGHHVVTVLARMYRPPALSDVIKNASVAVRFSLEMPEAANKIEREVRPPDNGFLYPYIAADPLGEEREGLKAWTPYYERLRSAALTDRTPATRALIDEHKGRHVAWIARRVLAILEDAPLPESDDLTGPQLSELAEYYRRQGLPERGWGIGRWVREENKRRSKLKMPKIDMPTHRAYYPDEEID